MIEGLVFGGVILALLVAALVLAVIFGWTWLVILTTAWLALYLRTLWQAWRGHRDNR